MIDRDALARFIGHGGENRRTETTEFTGLGVPLVTVPLVILDCPGGRNSFARKQAFLELVSSLAPDDFENAGIQVRASAFETPAEGIAR